MLQANCFAPFLRIDVGEEGGGNENMSASSAFAVNEDRNRPSFAKFMFNSDERYDLCNLHMESN